MRILIGDIETDGLLDQMTKVHSLVLEDATTGEVYSCADQPGYIPIEEGMRMLMEADLVVFHNGIGFDIPGLQKIYPWFPVDPGKVRDTLVLSRLVWPNLFDRDAGVIKARKLPPKLRGSHALKAWGYRLGVLKGDFGETTDWSVWSPEMQSYCEQDVTVTKYLWKKIQENKPPERAVLLEMWFAHIIGLQQRFGFKFNVQKAVALYTKLAQERLEMDQGLRSLFDPWYVNAGEFTPKGDNRCFGYTAGAPMCKVKLNEFNPASRAQIADRLIKLYGWEPTEFTPSGQPTVDETTLGKLPYPPAKVLAKRFMLEKRIGQIAEGNQAWLKLEKNGRIHGSVNTIGAVTGRCTHANPNVAQTPSVKAPYGVECRELYEVDEGYALIGADAAGLELRCLAHYMARYDGGAYAKVILEGDIHSVNASSLFGFNPDEFVRCLEDETPLIDVANEHKGSGEFLKKKSPGERKRVLVKDYYGHMRNNAKTFIYAFLYGAGDAKIGSIVGKGEREGKKLKANFLSRTPALRRLRDDVQAAVKKRKCLLGIDGRKLHVRSAHSALNTLLQSAGALLVKQATVNLYLELSTRGYIFGEDWAMVAHVHDEYQNQVLERLAEEVAEVAVWSFQQAGRDFNWRCPLDGEAKIGKNWAETH